MFSCFRGNNKESALMRNGALLLEKSIAFNSGRVNPIRCFSIEELKDATNNYDKNEVIFEGSLNILYKGFLHQEDRPVVVKKFRTFGRYLEANALSINEIVFASEMSGHKYVLKLLGYCSESEVPILVFEHANIRSTLSNCIYDNGRDNFQPLSWKNRLKIAVDVANVIAYLHTAFSRPIVHRLIKSSNILIDDDCIPKLHEFSLSISIPKGETHVLEDIIVGTFGFLAPEYVMNGVISEKVDVHSFGVVLLELLAARKLIENFKIDVDEMEHYLVDTVKKYAAERLGDMIDPVIAEEGTWPGKEHHLRAFLTLAIQCISYNAEDRPEITDVGKQLMLMYQSFISGN